MKKIAVMLAFLALPGSVFYFYLPERQSPVSKSSHENSSLAGHPVMQLKGQVQHSSSVHQSLKISAPPTSVPVLEEGFSAEAQQQNLENLAEQKYSILFSMLEMSAQTQQALRAQLFLREQILSSPFYDASSNEAEVAANLNKREADIDEIDRDIEKLFSEADVKKYRLLKDSSYEQALMNSFYELANAESSLSTEYKNKMLLAKLEQKQSTAHLLDGASVNIKNASPDTRAYLIEKTRQAMVSEKEAYLRSARGLLSDEQFDVLQDYEQQLFDERWQDIYSGFTAE